MTNAQIRRRWNSDGGTWETSKGRFQGGQSYIVDDSWSSIVHIDPVKNLLNKLFSTVSLIAQ